MDGFICKIKAWSMLNNPLTKEQIAGDFGTYDPNRNYKRF